MNFKWLVPKLSLATLCRFNGRLPSRMSGRRRCSSTIPAPLLLPDHPPSAAGTTPLGNPIDAKPRFFFARCFHVGRQASRSHSGLDLNPDPDGSVEETEEEEEEEDGPMNEFLSRFVWTMRPKIVENFPDCEKKTIDEMLLVIVQKVVEQMEKRGIAKVVGYVPAVPSQDLSEDLWMTVWEVTQTVLKDMEKEKRKEKMKKFLQSEEVKEMCRFAGEIGIRGDLLKELRFKWAKEKMEDTEFYDSLEILRANSEAGGEEVAEKIVGDGDSAVSGDKPKVVSLPKRKGKIRYKIYGLDLSDKKWSEVSDGIHEAGSVVWPQEPKPVLGKCKLIMERLLLLKQEDDPSSSLTEWTELLHPNRIDWMALLDQMKERNPGLYLKVAERILDEKSFEADIGDYFKLIDAHAKASRLQDVERLLKKMDENGFVPDILTLNVLVHMYCKSDNIERAKEAFESLKKHGFAPDVAVYNSMIGGYVNAGKPQLGESLVREMEAMDIKPTEEVLMGLLQSFAQQGDADGATRIANTMQFAGFQPSLESCSLLVEAYGRSGRPDEARSNFDYMRRLGHKPDDRCLASMIMAYEKRNYLDQALELLLELEKEGMHFGAATYCVLVRWMGKMGLVKEAEYFVGRISELGESPPLQMHVSLCDMYAKTRNEKKTLQTLQLLESKKEQLAHEDFETVIYGLSSGGFVQEAQRMRGWMESRGFSPSEKLNVSLSLMNSQAFNPRRQPTR